MFHNQILTTMKKYLYSILTLLVFAIGFAASGDSNENKKGSSISESTYEEGDEAIEVICDTVQVEESNATDDPTSQRYAWLQGHWVYDLPYGTRIHVVIEGNRILQYNNSRSESTNPTFYIQDETIYAFYEADIATTYKLDIPNKRIDLGDGDWMHKIEDSSSDVSTSSSDLHIMSRLKELSNKGTELTDELAVMRRSRQMDPQRFTSITQRILQYKQEQISLAEKLGDTQLVYEYQQQYSKLVDAIQMMENGY